MSEDIQIMIDKPNLLAQAWTFIENLIRFVEDENKKQLAKNKLSGPQKYSRFIYLFYLLYKTADFFFNFPDKVDFIIQKLAGWVQLIVDDLHQAGEFQRQVA